MYGAMAAFSPIQSGWPNRDTPNLALRVKTFVVPIQDGWRKVGIKFFDAEGAPWGTVALVKDDGAPECLDYAIRHLYKLLKSEGWEIA
jgi:hypothetical protein